MAAERNFWQVLVVTSKDSGVHTQVLEYPSEELAEETIAACTYANAELSYTYIGAFRLYPVGE